jgi:hypothetical protein
MTHGLKYDTMKSWGNRFHKMLKKRNAITKVYPEWLAGKVVETEGPLEEGVLEKTEKMAKDFLEWMK